MPAREGRGGRDGSAPSPGLGAAGFGALQGGLWAPPITPAPLSLGALTSHSAGLSGWGGHLHPLGIAPPLPTAGALRSPWTGAVRPQFFSCQLHHLFYPPPSIIFQSWPGVTLEG